MKIMRIQLAIVFGLLVIGSVMFLYQPAKSETTVQYDVITHNDRMGIEFPEYQGTWLIQEGHEPQRISEKYSHVFLSETVAIDDKLTVTNP